MNGAEILAFNAGVEAVLALAVSAARALEPQLAEKPTRFGFAHEALAAIAEEGRALVRPIVPCRPSDVVPAASPEPPKPPAPAAAAVELASIEG